MVIVGGPNFGWHQHPKIEHSLPNVKPCNEKGNVSI
jgi:hypothetical protein